MSETKPLAFQLLGLDDLAYLPAPSLEALFPQAAPVLPEELEGVTRGLLLANLDEPGWARRGLALLARSRLSFWRGLKLSPREDGAWEGVHLFGWQHPRPFLSCVAQAREDALVLDYDHPNTPRPLRALVDEVRRLRDGLFLGRWLVRLPRGPRAFGFFGLARTGG